MDCIRGGKSSVEGAFSFDTGFVIFVEHPIPFDELWRDSQLMELGTAVVRVASIAHLIEMKRIANRPEDQLDIEALTAILEAKKPS